MNPELVTPLKKNSVLLCKNGNIFAVYLPPNVTPLIQPMDQNVIRITKLYYRSSLFSSIISSKSYDMWKHLKELTIKVAVVLVNLSLAWNRLEVDTIMKCSRNILKFTEMLMVLTRKMTFLLAL